ncbi:Adenylate and Guanylate cyclase catalytic domain containing protein [Tritrichomonas foetus]|uniref:Adenylate and Guanylate cyclase catalytic domain containing protein n=1 Tax=Tritrichomonas foetus TaxID=1144522 RepID=A0A1J4KTN0_9EUKA|nr:Adenylate and Guanylate cyclase catalytic domain containing protein [Tritrichomonas foetus]|eukprot:OHT14623.1 Adenylate and Guanylate cyclase catalytic domain containing protein [Tritrichomonas foetus]
MYFFSKFVCLSKILQKKLYLVILFTKNSSNLLSNMQSTKPTASTLSQSLSMSVQTATYRQDLFSGKTSVLDIVFPMIDEMMRVTRIPNILYYILLIYYFIQVISISFWVQLPYPFQLSTNKSVNASIMANQHIHNSHLYSLINSSKKITFKDVCHYFESYDLNQLQKMGIIINTPQRNSNDLLNLSYSQNGMNMSFYQATLNQCKEIKVYQKSNSSEIKEGNTNQIKEIKPSIAAKIFEFFWMITFFTPISRRYTSDINIIDPEQAFISRFIITTIGVIIYFTMIIGQYLKYLRTRCFSKPTLFLSRLYIEFIPTIIIPPLTNFIGETFSVMIDSKNIASIIFFILGLIYLACFLLGHYLYSYLFAASVYISTAPTACWSGPFYFTAIIISCFPLFSYIFLVFASWMVYVLFVAKIVINIYICFGTIYLPYIHYHTNTIFAALFTSISVVDIMCLLNYAGFYLDDLFIAIVFIVLFIVSGGIWYAVTNRIITRVVRHLNDIDALNELEDTDDVQTYHISADRESKMAGIINLTDEKVRQLFIHFNMHKSQKRCELYLRIGLSRHCKLFLDWTLARFTAEYHNNSYIIGMITQFLCYFPCESRLLNIFYNYLLGKPNLSLRERFIVYQVHRVKNLRQSSASVEINDNLIKMKSKSNEGITAVRNFWKNVPQDPSILYNIHDTTDETCALFEECLENWPNNCRFCEEYSRYLIECATNFHLGLVMKNRSMLIEQGKNFIVDKCFRSLVRAYPTYLTRGIMDIKGHHMNRGDGATGGNKSSSNMSSGSQNSSVNSSTMQELDIEVEDRLGKVSFSQHRLRLAFQKCIDNRKSINNKHLIESSFVCIILAIGIVLFLFFYFYNFFADRQTNMEDQKILNRFRYGFDAAMISIMVQWAKESGLFDSDMMGDGDSGLTMINPLKNEFNLKWSKYSHNINGNIHNLKNSTYYIIMETLSWIEFSRENLEYFMKSVISHATEGENVYNTMKSIVSRVVSIDFCTKNQTHVFPLNNPVLETLKTSMSYGLLKLQNLTQVRYSNGSDWHVNIGLCECVVNIKDMFDAFDDLTLTITEREKARREITDDAVYFVIGIIIVSYFILTQTILIINLKKTLNEIHYLLKTMSEIDKDDREMASCPFKETNQDDKEIPNHSSSKATINEPLLYFTVIFYGIFSSAVYILFGVIIVLQNTSFGNLNNWLYYGISRTNYIIESIVFSLMYAFLVRNPTVTGMIDKQSALSLATITLDKLINYNNILLRGSDSINLPPCKNHYADLDKIHFANYCINDYSTPDESHDTYKCTSLDNGINLFKVYLSDMLDLAKDLSFKINGTFYHLFHLTNVHLLDQSFEATTILSNTAHIAIENYQTKMKIILFVGIIVLVAICVGFLISLKRLDIAFAGALQLLRRLPPLCVSSNVSFLNYLLNKKSNHHIEKMTTSKLIIMDNSDSIICLNKNESIEVVNKAVTLQFGYTPEQLLGQSISCILSEEENAKFHEQLILMKEGEAPLVFETGGKALSDDEQQIQVHIILLGIAESGSKSAKSFVIIMNDETELITQQKEAEEAKRQSEQLLYQILPRDIVTRLNSGETDISFVVPCASVMFIDISKFSDYSATLTPAQIMENLSSVFQAYDNIITKFPLMTKIKLIGDIYMAAANLFTPDEPIASHASQCVQFGLEVLQALEEINSQLNSNLSVRIGINSGGPVIAGVLGSDKPVFDIISDTINIAARLQSTGIPGTVQISEDTYYAIGGMNFVVEERGLIFLKGKGKRMAYIVRPTDQSSFFSVGSTTALEG